MIDAQDRVAHWSQTRDEIREAVLSRGWSESAQSFRQYFGSDELAASDLMLSIDGFPPAVDPRVLAANEAVDTRLSNPPGLVYRYRVQVGVVGFAGGEGTLLLRTSGPYTPTPWPAGWNRPATCSSALSGL